MNPNFSSGMVMLIESVSCLRTAKSGYGRRFAAKDCLSVSILSEHRPQILTPKKPLRLGTWLQPDSRVLQGTMLRRRKVKSSSRFFTRFSLREHVAVWMSGISNLSLVWFGSRIKNSRDSSILIVLLRMMRERSPMFQVGTRSCLSIDLRISKNDCRRRLAMIWLDAWQHSPAVSINSCFPMVSQSTLIHLLNLRFPERYHSTSCT